MKLRRFLAAALTLVMLGSAVPATVLAATGSESKPTEEGKLFLDKTATLTDDGSYTINMEAFATGTTTTTPNETGVPLDIVLVLDQSGSMKDNGFLAPLKTAVQTFVNDVQANGAKYSVEHRIGMVGFASGPTDGSSGENYPELGSNTKEYINTGIWNAAGDFKNYRGEKGTVSYETFNGTMVETGEYYVKVGSKYVKLNFVKGAENYVPVNSPATDRTDLYGLVSGKYEKATYGEYTETTRTEVTPVEGTEGYVDANGNPLTWKTITVPGEKKPGEKAKSIVAGKHYYILYNNQYLEIWQHGKNNWWRDKDNNAYDVDGANFTYGIWQFKTSYPAYEQITTEPTTKTVLTTADGTEYTGKVYTQTTATKTGWHVGNTPVTELFELVKGAGKWQYKNGGKNVDLKPKDQVYVKSNSADLTAADYQGALVPVAQEAKGQGAQRPSLKKAIDSIGSSGATRTSLGIEMGNKIFENNPLPEGNPEGRQRVMIVFTDGVPGYSPSDSYSEIRSTESALAIQQTNVTKKTHGASVYTIGLYKDGTADTQQTEFMSQLSSNYPDATYNFKQITSLPTNKADQVNNRYCIEINGVKYGLRYGTVNKDGEVNNKAKWNYFDRGSDPSRHENITANNGTLYEYTAVPGTAATEQKYSHEVTDPTALDGVFKTIQGSITGSATSVDLTTTSILRDIMSAEGFELTANSVVTVSVVSGDASKATSEKDIKWGTPVKVLTLTNPTDGASATGTYPDSTGKDMTIKASVHMKNPEAGKASLHTVDVTGFDYKDQYIAKAHKGSKLVVEITGVKALPTVTTDKNIFTNHEQSGIWAPVTEGGERALKAPFPKRPETYMPSKSYVVDYAKPLNLATADFKMNAAIDVDKDGYNPFKPANTAITHTYGNVKVEGGKLTYAPKTTKWDGYDTFYVFGKTDDATVTAASANANGNVWAKVNVIPANNVYYEDTFVTNNSTGTVGITYTGNWDEVKGTEPNANGGAAEDATNPDDVHGWIPVLKDETGDTDGSSHHTDVTGNKTATAKFTFTGTGVDVYSRTNGKTGTINVKLSGADGKTILRTSVDTLSASGAYYQIPTLSLYEDSKGVALPYGTYTVEIRVSTSAEGRYEYYLDGIRVYNPIKNGDPVVDGAYGPDEMNATFMEVRDMLLDAKSFSAQENGVPHGFVFIDQLNNGAPGTEGNTDKVLGVGTYEDLGPKNEVYLKPFQAISFKVDTTKDNKFYIGLKSPTGTPVTASFSGADGKMQMSSITHTADMYYAVAPASNGVITITNMGRDNELLSVTKLKVTNATVAVDTATVFAETDTPTLLAAATEFVNTPVEPEQPQQPDVEIIDPDFGVNPDHPYLPTVDDVRNFLDKIFGGFKGWFQF